MDHIDGTAPNERELHETEEDEESEPIESEQPESISEREEGEEEDPDADPDAANKNKIAGVEVGSNAMGMLGDPFSQQLLAAGDSVASAERLKNASRGGARPKPKYKNRDEPPEPVPLPVLPQNCYITISKKVLIEKMLAKYYLTWHPFPKIYGELLVFKTKKADQMNKKETIVYREYSLCKRLQMAPPQSKSLGNKKTRKPMMRRGETPPPEVEEEKEAKLQSFEVDILEPLAKEEWINFVKTIDSTKGLGWF